MMPDLIKEARRFDRRGGQSSRLINELADDLERANKVVEAAELIRKQGGRMDEDLYRVYRNLREVLDDYKKDRADAYPELQ